MPPPIRKQLHRREIPNHARFLTFSCFKRQPLLGTPSARDAFTEQLFLARSRLGFQLAAWVVMPEHVHLLVIPDPPALTISRILIAIKRPLAAQLLPTIDPTKFHLTDAAGKRRFWQRGGGYDRNTYSSEELTEKITYIHENPCRRELSQRTEDWEWSSARAYAGLESKWPEIDRIAL